MRLPRLPLALCGALSLVGCAALPFAQATNPSEGKAVLQVQPEIAAGQYAVQASVPSPQLVKPYTAGDVNHLLIKVYKVAGEVETQVMVDGTTPLEKDVPGNGMSSVYAFTKLHVNTSYHIKAFAYRAPGTDAANLISVDGDPSSVEVKVTDDERPALTTLKVQLIDKVFNGQATASGVVFTNGKLATSSFEAIN